MTFRYFSGLVLIVVAVLAAGCSKGNQLYNAGTKAESLNDYDTALENYNKALRADPNNTEFKLKAARARFEASTWHLEQGQRLRDQSNLELALGEFRKALMIAIQELLKERVREPTRPGGIKPHRPDQPASRFRS